MRFLAASWASQMHAEMVVFLFDCKRFILADLRRKFSLVGLQALSRVIFLRSLANSTALKNPYAVPTVFAHFFGWFL